MRAKTAEQSPIDIASIFFATCAILATSWLVCSIDSFADEKKPVEGAVLQLGAGPAGFASNKVKDPGAGGVAEFRIRNDGKPDRVEASIGSVGGKTIGQFDFNMAAGDGKAPALNLGIIKTPNASDMYLLPLGVAVPVFSGFVQASGGIGVRSDLRPPSQHLDRKWTETRGQGGIEGRIIFDQNLLPYLNITATLAAGTRAFGNTEIETTDKDVPIKMEQGHGGHYASLKLAADVRPTSWLYVHPEVIADGMMYKATMTTPTVVCNQTYHEASVAGFVYVGLSMPVKKAQ